MHRGMPAAAQRPSVRDGLAEIHIDERPMASSALRSGLAEAIDEAVDAVLAEPTARAGVLILGRDPELGRRGALPATRARAEAACRAEQAALRRLEASPKPFVAWLEGPTRGLAFELALACRARLVVGDRDATTLALTDTAIGLAPRLGGLHRIAEIGGLALAISLGTAGRPLGASEAEALGLIEGAVSREEAV